MCGSVGSAWLADGLYSIIIDIEIATQLPCSYTLCAGKIVGRVSLEDSHDSGTHNPAHVLLDLVDDLCTKHLHLCHR